MTRLKYLRISIFSHLSTTYVTLQGEQRKAGERGQQRGVPEEQRRRRNINEAAIVHDKGRYSFRYRSRKGEDTSTPVSYKNVFMRRALGMKI